MWIVVIIVVIVFLFIMNKYFIISSVIKKIKSNGGMLTVYNTLVEGILEDRSAKILGVGDNSINLGVINIDGSTIFKIVQLYDTVTIEWKFSSVTFGQHSLRWEFPNGLDQNKMLSTITTHIKNYNQTKISRLVTSYSEVIHESLLNKNKLDNLSVIDFDSENETSVSKKVYFNKMDELNPSSLDLVELFYQLSKSMVDETKNSNKKLNDTKSGILYEWTYDYAQFKKIDNMAFSMNNLSYFYDTDQSSILQLIESKKIIENRKYKKYDQSIDQLENFISQYANAEKANNSIDED